MGKQIAVFMCAVNIDDQRQILEGMIDAAKETDSNLYVFTNYISYLEKEEHIQGAYRIMYLPDMSYFDGAIIVPNSIQYQRAAEHATQIVYESGIPAVSIDVELPDMSYIANSTYEAAFELVEHFIVEHNCDEIYYVSGPLYNVEGETRYRAYRDALKKHGIGFEEEYLYQGYFDVNSGVAAVEEFLKDGKCPRTIVCGNDGMAIGVAKELKKRGYRIPEDVYVAGFDDGELAGLNNPPLTTVNKNLYEVGRLAVREIMYLSEGGACRSQQVSCKLEIRKSCGCDRDSATNVGELRERHFTKQLVTQNVADIMRNMMADFSGMESPDELMQELQKFIVRADIEEFYLCLCDREKIFQLPEDNLSGAVDLPMVNRDYTDQISIPLAYENGEFGWYRGFRKGMVLPEEIRNRCGGNFYIVAPIFYQRCCYGYCVSGNSTFPLEYSLYYSWLMNIGVGLENVRKWMLLKDTVVKLNGMWVYDMLTHLYNRAGFFHSAKPLLEQIRQENADAFLIFIDIDGLKQVNDGQGHEAGDDMICGMAEVIKKCMEEQQIAMRYGGDEFVIFGSCQNSRKPEWLVESIREEMGRRNSKKGMTYQLAASIGVSRFKASEITGLDELIEKADKKMYEEKKHKHMEQRMREMQEI